MKGHLGKNTWTPVSTTTGDGVVHQFTGVYNTLAPKLLEDGKTLVIPAGTSVKEGGYTLTVTVHERRPTSCPLPSPPSTSWTRS